MLVYLNVPNVATTRGTFSLVVLPEIALNVLCIALRN